MNINVLVLLIFLVTIILFITFNRENSLTESFNTNGCYKKKNRRNRGECRLCPEMPDMSKYVLKSSIPPCPKCPNLDNYVLKTKMEEGDDMSRYVLKSSIPPCNCPPCPPCKCPEPKCPSLYEIKELIKNEDKERRKHYHNKYIESRSKNNDYCKNNGYNISYSKYGLLSDFNKRNDSDDNWNNYMAAPTPENN